MSTRNERYDAAVRTLLESLRTEYKVLQEHLAQTSAALETLQAKSAALETLVKGKEPAPVKPEFRLTPPPAPQKSKPTPPPQTLPVEDAVERIRMVLSPTVWSPPERVRQKARVSQALLNEALILGVQRGLLEVRTGLNGAAQYRRRGKYRAGVSGTNAIRSLLQRHFMWAVEGAVLYAAEAVRLAAKDPAVQDGYELYRAEACVQHAIKQMLLGAVKLPEDVKVVDTPNGKAFGRARK